MSDKKFSIKDFRETIKDVQRAHYFQVDFLDKDGNNIVDIEHYVSCMVRDIKFEKTEFDFDLMYFRTLMVSDRTFWKTIKKIDNEEGLVMELRYLSKEGTENGGLKFTGLRLKDIDLTGAETSQESSDICTATLIISYMNKEIITPE